MEHALEVGNYLTEELSKLKEKHAVSMIHMLERVCCNLGYIIEVNGRIATDSSLGT